MITFFDRNPVKFTLILLMPKAMEGVSQPAHKQQRLSAHVKTSMLFLSN
jgi:hypothetical protein